MQTNPKVTNIAVDGDAGAVRQYRLDHPRRKVEVMEDPTLNSGTPQGLQGYCVNPRPAARRRQPISPARTYFAKLARANLRDRRAAPFSPSYSAAKMAVCMAAKEIMSEDREQ